MKLGAVTEDEQLENGLEHVDAVDPNEVDQSLAGGSPAEKKAAVDPLVVENKRLAREAKDARKLAKENDETARYWAEQARVKPAAAVAEVDPADELGEVDLVDEISTKGVKGLDALLKKLGYAKTNDVASAIGQTRAEITDQSALLTTYPDLADPDSPFFKATAKIFNSLKTDVHMAKSPKLIATAARLAKAEMGTAPRRKAAPDPDLDLGDDDDEQDGDVEDAQASRVARQSGDRGRRQVRSDDAPQLSAMQKKMVKQFAAVGAPVTEENYLKRAMSGSIRMGGRGGR